MESVLIETSACGSLKPKILHFTEDVDNVADINWCGYLLSVLSKTHIYWSKNKTKAFSGPLHFMVVSTKCPTLIFSTDGIDIYNAVS